MGGDAAAAGEDLRGGLRLAAAAGYRRAFLDGGRPAAELLRLVRSAAPELVADLLARFAATQALIIMAISLAALCADTPLLAERLARAAQIAGVPMGYLTNLTDLADGFVQGLWTHRWRNPYSPLEAW